MKSILVSFIISLCILPSAIAIFAATAEDYFVVLENISEKCPHGRQVIFRDTNGDGEYDTIRKTYCDGTYDESPMIVVGNGSFGRIGAYAEVISGDIDSDSFVVRVYFPGDNTTLGYLEKQSGNPVVTFTFTGN